MKISTPSHVCRRETPIPKMTSNFLQSLKSHLISSQTAIQHPSLNHALLTLYQNSHSPNLPNEQKNRPHLIVDPFSAWEITQLVVLNVLSLYLSVLVYRDSRMYPLPSILSSFPSLLFKCLYLIARSRFNAKRETNKAFIRIHLYSTSRNCLLYSSRY